MQVPTDRLGAYTKVGIKRSIVLDAPLDLSWRHIREWGKQHWFPLLPDGSKFEVHVLDGFAPAEVGAVRAAHLGDTARVYEQLVAMDDQTHTLKWRGVSHPEVVNPFEEASFINFHTKLQCHSITLGPPSPGTFVEWEGECYTEPAFAASVHLTFEAWFSGGLLSLREYMRKQLAREPGLARPRSRTG